MDVILAIGFALLGLVVGSLLTTVVARTPAGTSWTHPGPECDRCAAPIQAKDRVPVVSWLLLRGRCRSCSAAIPATYPVVEVATGVLFLSTLLALGLSWELPAYLYLAALAVAATAIDLAHHRLPDAIVLPSYPITLGLLAVASAGLGTWPDLGRAVLGGLALFVFFFLLAFINPSGMGGGDIKLAGVLGMLLGWIGWWPVIVGALSAFFLGAFAGLGLLIVGKAGRKSAIPFGPFMFAGCYVGLLFGTPFGQWYLR